MDTSKLYIKMCEKSEEIQGQRVAAWHMMEAKQIYFYDGDDVWFAYTVGEGLEQKLNKVWLPRQDQLQEMINWSEYQFSACFGEFVHLQAGEKDSPYKSMEQLWLAFVMKEKYGKSWNGTGWVKKED